MTHINDVVTSLICYIIVEATCHVHITKTLTKYTTDNSQMEIRYIYTHTYRESNIAAGQGSKLRPYQHIFWDDMFPKTHHRTKAHHSMDQAPHTAGQQKYNSSPGVISVKVSILSHLPKGIFQFELDRPAQRDGTRAHYLILKVSLPSLFF